MKQYRRFSERQGDEGTNFGTTFTRLWHRPLIEEIDADATPNMRKRLADALQGGILLDVGCGDRESRHTMQEVAKTFGAAHYIGLDQLEIDGTHPFQQSNVRYERKVFAPVELYYHQQDMLLFLARLQRETMAAVAINGIDSIVIPSGNYHHALAREIARVLRPGGVVFGINSTVGYYLEEFRLRTPATLTPFEADRGFSGENFFLEKPEARK
jgi:SAM-dependent methyltransferase